LVIFWLAQEQNYIKIERFIRGCTRYVELRLSKSLLCHMNQVAVRADKEMLLPERELRTPEHHLVENHFSTLKQVFKSRNKMQKKKKIPSR